MILKKNNFEYYIHEVICDENGRYITLDITIENLRFSIVNLYGPNSDTPVFFQNLETKLMNMPETPIVAGDWNVVQDFNADTYNYKHRNNISANKRMLDMKKNLELALWIHGEYLIQISYKSDHSLISLELSLQPVERDPGYWKFNHSLLRDTQYVKLVKYIIDNTVDECYVDGDREDLGCVEFSINDQSFFELLKIKLRSETIAYSITRNKENNKHEKVLEKDIIEFINIYDKLS